nr:DUF2199 domain-containing protein [Bacillus pseudomycoides]
MHQQKFTCNHLQQELPMCYGSDAPFYYYSIPERERQKRFELNADLCIMDGEHYFIRCCIEIPVLNSNETFMWDVWVSLSKVNFDRTMELWETEGREGEEPYFGWLSTSIPGYPETLNLKTNVHTRAVGVRPLIELEPTNHPLAVEQREGITVERVKEIKEMMIQHD